MKAGLKAGDSFEFSTQVREEMQPQFEGQIIHPLYSTAAMINHMEWAARQHILPYLETNEDGVGYHVDVKHLAATPLGATVKIRSTVTRFSPLKVISQVEAWNDTQKIGEGTLVQAIVPRERLYESPADTTANMQENEVPPAKLTTPDGKTGFEFEILKWETGQFPCSRYDEWLICELRTIQNGKSQTYKGPFLLRHEVEEWREAALKLSEGQGSGFQSDFLEPVLKLNLAAGEPGECQCVLHLRELDDTPQGGHNHQTLRMDVSEKALRIFAEQLWEQLEGFPSKL